MGSNKTATNELYLKERATPTNEAGWGKVYPKTDKKLYYQDSDGNEVDISSTEFSDNQFRVYDNSDSTKILALDCSSVTTGNTRTITVSDGDLDLDSISYSNLQDVSATDRILGRETAGSGVVEEITCTAAGRALLDDADAAAQRTTLSLDNVQNTKVNFSATSNPGVGDDTGDGYSVGSMWINITSDRAYTCVDATSGAAVWKPSMTDSTPQTLTGAGAVDITSRVTLLVTTGSDALTLADGIEGQEKTIKMKTDGGDGTLTPANFANGTTITFNDVGDSVNLIFTDSSWLVTGYYGVTIA